ncbi:MAG: hypothetical protein ACMG57_00450 [Candidatus Dojkabacteria bacterium]
MAPKRFRIYIICYVVSLLIFVINIFGALSQSFIFVAFALSSFFLVFTIEALPTGGFDKPQIHFYEKSRLNSYTYWMLILFVGTALSYYILNGIFRINGGLVIIVLWPICILISQYIFRKTAPNIPLEMINDYLRSELKITPTYEENKLILELIRKLLPTLYGNRSKKEIERFEKEFDKKGLNKEFFEKAVQSIEEYLDLTSDKLTSNEITQLEITKKSEKGK